MVLARNDVGIRNLTNPNVAEFGRVVVILDRDRFAIGVRLVLRGAMEEGVALDSPVILNDAAVEQNGDVRGTNDFGDEFVAVFIFFRTQNRTGEDDIVGLPFGRFLNAVHVRRELLVDRTALTFKIRGIFIGIKNVIINMLTNLNGAKM